jgi:hypothetical protein
MSGFRLIVHPELMLVNDVSNTGLSHGGEMKKLLRLFTDNRSLYNFRVNRAFLKKYAKGPLAYLHLCQFYAILIMSFIKAILTKPFKTS